MPVLLASLASATLACTQELPPTVTPGLPVAATTPGLVVEMTVPAPQRSAPVVVDVRPLVITELAAYRDPEGRYSMRVPTGWPANPQPVSGSDHKLGVLFPAPEGNGFISVTQFDNGRAPMSVGTMASQVMDMTGVTRAPGYIELARESVIERPDSALRVHVAYVTSAGINMQSLSLFQVDGTVFSMVTAAAVAEGFRDVESALRQILGSYRVPAGPLE